MPWPRARALWSLCVTTRVPGAAMKEPHDAKEGPMEPNELLNRTTHSFRVDMHKVKMCRRHLILKQS